MHKVLYAKPECNFSFCSTTSVCLLSQWSGLGYETPSLQLEGLKEDKNTSYFLGSVVRKSMATMQLRVLSFPTSQAGSDTHTATGWTRATVFELRLSDQHCPLQDKDDATTANNQRQCTAMSFRACHGGQFHLNSNQFKSSFAFLWTVFTSVRYWTEMGWNWIEYGPRTPPPVLLYATHCIQL